MSSCTFYFLTLIFLTLVTKSFAIIPWNILINTNNVIVITNTTYGAVGDGVFTNTTPIQNAINVATAGGTTNGLIGGKVEIPAGTFLCGPLTLKKNVNLQIDAGAILRMLPYDKYPGGIVSPANFISGSSLTNSEISGFGAIDGQGVPWWPGYKTNNRPTTIVFSKCSAMLLQDFTISNTPAQNISIKGNNAGNVTIRNLTEIAPDSAAAVPSHNTDGIDLAETNCLVQDCNISVGDDNIAMGSSAGLSRDILVTNCNFGYGHGVSIGSYTSSGVSNLTVINCTFNLTQNGIRLKSDNDRGGLTQNLLYCNIGMTNVNFPFQIYSYYNEVGTPSSITPLYAATQAVASVNSTTPVWRDITFSNITVTSVSGYPIGILWARTEMPATNIIFNKVNITGDRSFDVYNVQGVQFIDCNLKLSVGTTTFELFNSQFIITNSAPTNTLFTLDGLTTNVLSTSNTVINVPGNNFAFYNAQASLRNTNVLDDGPLTLSASTLTVSNNLNLFPSTILNFAPGTSATKISVTGNLNLGGTINVTNGEGFTNGTYTLLTYNGNLTGTLPTLGMEPSGFNFSLDTNTIGQVNLVVALPISLTPTNLSFQVSGNQLQLSWPADHLGWRLQIQTNDLSIGLSTNWFTVDNSTNINALNLPIDPTVDAVFLRLTYP